MFVAKFLQLGVTYYNSDQYEHRIETGTWSADYNAHLFYTGHADCFGSCYFDRYLEYVKDRYNREQHKIVVEHMGEIDVKNAEQAEEHYE